MGSNNIPSASPNTTIPASDHNSIRTAMIGDYVPRNSSANPEDVAGSMGQSAFRWLQGFFRTVFIGVTADNISIAADAGDCVILVGGVERARIPQTIGLQPAGMISGYSGTSDPAGWLLCDGREVSRTTYARLYASIANTYGNGNTTTTFNLPDLRGRFLRGSDDMGTGAAGRDPDAGARTAMDTGGNSGDAVGSIQADQAGPHTHDFTHEFAGTPVGDIVAGTNIFSRDPATKTTASNGTTETRPKNANINYIIKT